MTQTIERPNTRSRLIAAMINGLRTRGYHGVGLNALLATAQAPKGVLYHHFPGGKSELAVHAIESVVERLGTDLEKVIKRTGDPVGALEAWMSGAQKVLEKSGFDSGCPLATIALESTADDQTIRKALATAFEQLRAQISSSLATTGMTHAMAQSFAALIISAYEGALLQARVSGSGVIMKETSETLIGLIRMSLREPKEFQD